MRPVFELPPSPVSHARPQLLWVNGRPGRFQPRQRRWTVGPRPHEASPPPTE
jgi:hypothetical protein